MKKKIKIGFDMDGIFASLPPFVPSVIIEALYKRRNGKLQYRIPGKLEQKIRILSHHHILRPAILENVSAIGKIIENKDVETYVISSRFSFLKDRTTEWNLKHNMVGLFKKMYFNFEDTQPHIFKERIIRDENINKFIDDDLDLLVYLSERNPSVEFYWINKKTDKRHFPKNIHPVKNLEEFLRMYA